MDGMASHAAQTTQNIIAQLARESEQRSDIANVSISTRAHIKHAHSKIRHWSIIPDTKWWKITAALFVGPVGSIDIGATESENIVRRVGAKRCRILDGNKTLITRQASGMIVCLTCGMHIEAIGPIATNQSR